MTGKGITLLDKIAIGTDIEEIRRFEGKETNQAFLSKVYTVNELEYCLKFKYPAQHFCARFCAKEAIVKALSALGIKDVYYSDIEIHNEKDGTPFASIEKHNDIRVRVSLSHCKNYAMASAIVELI